MFGLIKKFIFIGTIILVTYLLIVGDGINKLNKLKDRIIKKEKVEENETTKETKDLKKDPWSHVDKPVPEEFDSGERPDSSFKSTIKKLKNIIKDDYGYKR